MFALNEKVVYPGHGVARVSAIFERIVGGRVTHFYELKFIHKEMTILVPVDNLACVGVRCVCAPNTIRELFTILTAPMIKDPMDELTISSWNKRSKKYHALLRSGDLLEVAKIYRDLRYIALHKELSFGERALLAQAEILLAEEIALVESVDHEAAIQRLRSLVMPEKRAIRKEKEAHI